MTVDVLAGRTLGRTGWSVTGLCIGTGELGNIPVYGEGVPDDLALATARRAFAGPLTFLDTSNGYGISEQRLGVVIREARPRPRWDAIGDQGRPQRRRSFRRSTCKGICQ